MVEQSDLGLDLVVLSAQDSASGMLPMYVIWSGDPLPQLVQGLRLCSIELSDIWQDAVFEEQALLLDPLISRNECVDGVFLSLSQRVAGLREWSIHRCPALRLT